METIRGFIIISHSEHIIFVIRSATQGVTYYGHCCRRSHTRRRTCRQESLQEEDDGHRSIQRLLWRLMKLPLLLTECTCGCPLVQPHRVQRLRREEEPKETATSLLWSSIICHCTPLDIIIIIYIMIPGQITHWGNFRPTLHWYSLRIIMHRPITRIAQYREVRLLLVSTCDI